MTKEIKIYIIVCVIFSALIIYAYKRGRWLGCKRTGRKCSFWTALPDMGTEGELYQRKKNIYKWSNGEWVYQYTISSM